MKFHVVSLFPESIESYRSASIIKRAEEKRLISIASVNPRDFSFSKHNTVDDKSYGGGPGMVMMALPILRAVEHSLNTSSKGVKKIIATMKRLFSQRRDQRTKYVVFSPSGTLFTQNMAQQWAIDYDDIVLICGRYEGIDDRVRQILNAEEVSIGEYVLTGGELPALVVMDAISRHIPDVLGNHESLEEQRIASSRTYTRPESITWQGKEYAVPPVLVQGNHKAIEQWRSEQV